MVLDTAKLKNRKSTKKHSTRGRDVAKELTLKKKNITKVFTIVFLETNPSLSRIATQSWLDRAKCIVMDELAQQSHVPSLQRGIQEIPRTVVSHIEQVGQKRSDATSIRLSSCSLNQKMVSIVYPSKKLQNPLLLNNIGDGTLPQAIHGGTGTRPKAGGAHERSIHFFVAVSFAYS